jgi:hypothetical protein
VRYSYAACSYGERGYGEKGHCPKGNEFCEVADVRYMVRRRVAYSTASHTERILSVTREGRIRAASEPVGLGLAALFLERQKDRVGRKTESQHFNCNCGSRIQTERLSLMLPLLPFAAYVNGN